MKVIFTELSQQDLINAATYFPSLASLPEIKIKLNKGELGSIAKKKTVFNALDDREKLIELIEECFDLNKYGDLTQLSNLEWVTQLRVRKKILAHLNQSNNTNYKDRLQLTIFEICQSPILSTKKYGPNLSTKNIKDLTIEELHSISKTYQNNGAFNFIENDYDRIGSDLYGFTSKDEYELISSISEAAKFLDNEFKVVATIDLNIDNTQLKKEFANFLDRKRDELKLKATVKKFTDGKTTSLGKHCVLQYLDLLILSNYLDSNFKLHHKEYAGYLFPYDHPKHEAAIDTFRDTTLKHTEDIINGDFIHRLLSFINKEQGPSFRGM